VNKLALISVSDKTNLDWFAKGLVNNGFDILSTGGTAKYLREHDIPVTDVSEYTGAPEILEGRVKTLHPKLYGGILATDSDKDTSTLDKYGYHPIDMVVVNLYPFQEVIKKEDITLEDAIENIDIGGVTLLRAAAKNFNQVVVLSNPSQYNQVLDDLRVYEDICNPDRMSLAELAFKHTMEYDMAIYAFYREMYKYLFDNEAEVIE